MCLLFSFFHISRCPFPYLWRHFSMTSKYVSRHISWRKILYFQSNISEKKNQTPVRGQDGKISDTSGKDFYWSPTRQILVGDLKSFPWVSEIFPSCPLTGVRSFISFYISENRDRNFDWKFWKYLAKRIAVEFLRIVL